MLGTLKIPKYVNTVRRCSLIYDFVYIAVHHVVLLSGAQNKKFTSKRIYNIIKYWITG